MDVTTHRAQPPRVTFHTDPEDRRSAGRKPSPPAVTSQPGAVGSSGARSSALRSPMIEQFFFDNDADTSDHESQSSLDSDEIFLNPDEEEPLSIEDFSSTSSFERAVDQFEALLRMHWLPIVSLAITSGSQLTPVPGSGTIAEPAGPKAVIPRCIVQRQHQRQWLVNLPCWFSTNCFVSRWDRGSGIDGVALPSSTSSSSSSRSRRRSDVQSALATNPDDARGGTPAVPPPHRFPILLDAAGNQGTSAAGLRCAVEFLHDGRGDFDTTPSGKWLQWCFPLLPSIGAIVVTPLPSGATTTTTTTSEFSARLAQSVAACASEHLLGELSKRQATVPPAATSLGSQGAGATQRMSGPTATATLLVPPTFVPVFSKDAENSSEFDNARYTQLLRGNSVKTHHTATGYANKSFVDRPSSRTRYSVEVAEACPINVKYLGDAVDLLHLLVGLKCRHAPTDLLAGSVNPKMSPSSALSTPSSPAADVFASRSAPTAASAFGSGDIDAASTWATVEHQYSLQPSPRRCDWEDLQEAVWASRISELLPVDVRLSAGATNFASASAATSSSAQRGSISAISDEEQQRATASLAVGPRVGTSLNPLDALIVRIAWPWVDAVSAADGANSSAFDVVVPPGGGTTGATRVQQRPVAGGAAPLAPQQVHAVLRLRNSYEFSRLAGDTLQELAYPLIFHCQRIAEDLSAEDGAALHEQQRTQHRRLSSEALASLAAEVFGNSPLPPQQRGGDAYRIFGEVPRLNRSSDTVSSHPPPLVPRRRMILPYYLSLRHVFSRFASACATALEDPDDVHRLWLYVVDKLRTKIEMDRDGRGDWRAWVDPGCLPTSPSTPEPIQNRQSSTRVLHASNKDDGGGCCEYARIDFHAPLVMQKLQLLWSTATMHLSLPEEHDNAEKDKGRTAAHRSAVGSGHPHLPSSAAAAAVVGWEDEMSDDLFDCEETVSTPTGNAPTLGTNDDSMPAASSATTQGSSEAFRSTEAAVSAGTAQEHDGGVSRVHQPNRTPASSSVKLLAVNRLLVTPPRRRHALCTSDEAEAQQRAMMKLGAGAKASDTRQWLLSQDLRTDMALFLHANGAAPTGIGASSAATPLFAQRNGVTFADFVRWHSPRDFVSSTAGKEEHLEELRKQLHDGALTEAKFCNRLLSQRMQVPQDDDYSAQGHEPSSKSTGASHLWWSCWIEARPRSLVEVEQQSALTTTPAALILDWLENDYSLEELLGDVLLSNIAHALANVEEILRRFALADQTSHLLPWIAEQVAEIDQCIRAHWKFPGCAGLEASSSRAGDNDELEDGNEDEDDVSRRGNSIVPTSQSWTTTHAIRLKDEIKAVIARVERIEDVGATVLAVSSLLFPEAKTSLPPPRPVRVLVDRLVAQSVGVTVLRSCSDVVEVSREDWAAVLAPAMRRGAQQQPSDSSTSSSVDDSATSPASSLSLLAIQAHLLCLAERPIGACYPSLTQMHLLWDWTQSGGTSPAPAARSTLGWTNSTRPQLTVRTSVEEEA